MTILRRFLVIQALLLWQGGFLFYASFVVPIGTQVLGDAFEQARITRYVTNGLNIVGGVSLLFLAWDMRNKYYRRGRWLCWALMALGLIGLVLLHPKIEGLADFEARTFNDYPQFYFLHRCYLWISTLQWIAAMAFTILTLRSWREEDGSTNDQV